MNTPARPKCCLPPRGRSFGRLLCSVSLAVMTLTAGVSDASEGIGSSQQDFTLSGFGTLGAVRTTSNNVEFVRDLSQPRGAGRQWTGLPDSVLGVQANWRIERRVEAVVQVNSRYRPDRSFTPDLAWAYLKYDPFPNLSLRAGRLATEFFMLADSRWVGYSFLPVRPPGDYFWYLPFYSIHGADASLTLPLGESQLRAKVFAGKAHGDVPLADENWNTDGSSMLGSYLEYHRGAWLVRGSYATLRFAHDLPINPVLQKAFGFSLGARELSYLGVAGTTTRYYALGAVYDDGPWQAQLMFNYIDQGSQAFESSVAAYGLLGYRLGAWTPYIGYSGVRSKTRNNATANPVVSYVMQDSHADQRTAFAGVRWDFARNLALKAQWDGIRGSNTSLLPYRRDVRESWGGDMNVFSLSLDFIF